MNELESFYQQNAGSVESMGFEARQGISSRTGALNVFEAKASAEEEEATDKEKLDEEGGGAGLAGGMLSKEGIQQVGKQVLGKAKTFAQQKIQKVIDDIKTKVATPDATPPAPDATPPAPASTSTPPAPASQADIEDGLENRFNALSDDVKKVISQRIKADPNATPSTSTTTPAEAKLSNDALDKHISDGENYGTADPPVAPNIPSPIAGTPTTTSTTSTTVDTSISRQLGGSTLPAPTAPDVTATPMAPTTNPSGVIDDATQNLADKATNITQKGMDTLSDKIGVDFGDLTAKQVGTGLSDTLADSAVGGAVSKVSAGLEAFGGVADFLGPIGMIAGIGASIAGLVKGVEERKQVKEKQAQIGTIASGINSTAGMSFGSIASTNLDTSQFRSGGLAGNF
tara:strand:+ start:18 stop:1217 length:1200 start_codon:yes stop_codon:yes gene_type:complete